MTMNTNLQTAIAECETPCYVFDEAVLARRISHLRECLPQDVAVCYAMKANPFVLETAAREADLVEVCSPGELDICRALGIPYEKLVISGVHKDRPTMSGLVESHANVHRFTAESVAQFELLEELARSEGRVIPLLVRLTSGNQFGMDASDAKRVAAAAQESPLFDLHGVQFFSGTQKTSAKRLQREVGKLDAFLAELAAECGADMPELEYGPGLPVEYRDGQDAEAEELALLAALSEALSGMSFKGAKTLEIGRSIAASCGTYLTRVVDVKRNRGQNYAIVDGGKHQVTFFSPALALEPPAFRTVPDRTMGETEPWTICGSLCTTGDLLVRQASLSGLRIGDHIALPNAGAYCATEGMALFLSRDLPSVYLRDGKGALRLARNRIQTSTLNTPL